MRVLVIGTGWYGCHLARILIEKEHAVTLVDKTNSFFQGSSSKNQNRLHQGFHYPRSQDTIHECQSGYARFTSQYPHLSDHVPYNYYILSKNGSHTTASDYMNTYRKTQIAFEYKDVSDAYLPLPMSRDHVEPTLFITEERYINPFRVADYFTSLLAPHLHSISSSEVFRSIDSIVAHFDEPFDLILNCTYNQLEPIEFDHYELYATFLYKIPTPVCFAYTIMDGPFFSIYPYRPDEHIYTVTSVKHGILESARTIPVSEGANIAQHRASMEANIVQYIPSWHSAATYVDSFLSWKTKPATQSDDRSLRHKICGKVLSFYGGKITGIFNAEDILIEHLKSLE